MDNKIIRFEIGPEGACQAAKRGDLCIIVDVLRASSSIIAAFMGGIKSIRLGDNSSFDVSKLEITAGEQNCIKIDHLTYGNSPEDLLHNSHQGCELLFFSTNGIPSIKACTSYKVPVLIGAIINADTVGRLAKEIALRLNINISIVLAGYKGNLENDDLLTGSLIYNKQLQSFQLLDTGLLYSDNLLDSLLTCPAGLRLSQLNLEKDIYFCAQEDITKIVPIYDEKIKQLVPIAYPSGSWENLLC
ncbi:2-phosphosulfolactate phosphatase [Legionella antarctica]|uniref:Probable 2-phosphosulfolactate phosphatase n=1 Tax=Legionella antarctica TaxID=2708020 RepID=A0A6F8T729_9GAMM|nr:2-phosphosulfolactate phosphatase [Legionella antarctica]BCA95950.1 2-phosphosulfolactate phosphatase [Legionella antarctica]